MSLNAGRLVNKAMNLLGRRSTALPGYIAERLSGDSLQAIMRQRQYRAIVCITGTNGKTTTTLLTKTALEAAGFVVVNNSSGSNLYRGILTTLLDDSRSGRDTVLLLEVDEASMRRVARAVRPTHIVVLNLFRDQLDRYGEVDTTKKMLAEAIADLPGTELMLNADDPHVVSLASDYEGEVRYFGLNVKGLKALPHDHASDVPLSPKTGSPIEYKQRYFGHVGIWSAGDDSFRRPKPQLVVQSTAQSHDDGATITYTLHEKQHQLKTNLTGLYSTYNVAATTLLLDSLGLKQADIQQALVTRQAAFGRQEIVRYKGKALQFFLIKNPTGFNQVIQAHLQEKKKLPILIVINDNFADGRDISWLWDAAVEDIQAKAHFIVSGSRAFDMALRLEYADKDCEVIPDPQAALRRLADLTHATQSGYVLPTYTALLELRKHLALNLEHSQ